MAKANAVCKYCHTVNHFSGIPKRHKRSLNGHKVHRHCINCGAEWHQDEWGCRYWHALNTRKKLQAKEELWRKIITRDRQIIIVSDLDGTIRKIDNAIVDWVNKLWGINFPYEKFTSYDSPFLDPRLPVSSEAAREIVFGDPAFWQQDFSLIPGAVEVLSELKQQGAQIVIMSHQRPQIQPLTELYLLQRQVPYDRLYFTAPKDKLHQSLSFQGDILIEDYEETIQAAIEHKFPTFLMKSQQNRKLWQYPHQYLIPVNNWYGIKYWLDKILKPTSK